METEDIGVIPDVAACYSKGFLAGRSLKNLLVSLANPTDKARAIMDEYGISIFDSSGEAKDLSQLAVELSAIFGDMTKEQQTSIAKTLVGGDDIAAFLGMIK